MSWSPAKPLLVGNCPPNARAPSASGGPAFVGTSSGRNLASLFGLPSSEALTEHFELVNLTTEPARSLSVAEARERVEVIRICHAAPNRKILWCSTLGRTAAGLKCPPMELVQVESPRLHVEGWLWHPSGLTRNWNSPEHRAEAREFFDRCLRARGVE